MNKERRALIIGTACVALSAGASVAQAGNPNAPDVFTAIKTRRSVRAYSDAPVSEADITTMLEAAMLAPSAANEQPWEFVVIQDRAMLTKIGETFRYATFAARAALAILVCLNKSKEKIMGMAIIDMGMCSQNILLAAHGLGLGAVFTGVYPDASRMTALREICKLPPQVEPIGLIVIGQPKSALDKAIPDRFNKDAIHRNVWQGK